MIIAKSSSIKGSQVWLEFFELEREFGDEKHQRRLLNRALNEVIDDEKEIIFDVLYKFEKQNGNIQQFSLIYTKYQKFKEQKMIELASAAKNVVKKDNTNRNKKNEPPTQKSPQVKKPQEKQAKIEKSNNLKRKNDENDTLEVSQPKKPATIVKDKDGFVVPALPMSLPVSLPIPNASTTPKTAPTATQKAASLNKG